MHRGTVEVECIEMSGAEWRCAAGCRLALNCVSTAVTAGEMDSRRRDGGYCPAGRTVVRCQLSWLVGWLGGSSTNSNVERPLQPQQQPCN